MKLLYISLFLVAAISGNAEELSSPIKIIQPLDMSRYVGENSTFVVDVIPEQIDTIVITQDNNKTTTLEVKSAKKTYCKNIKLHIGNNKISVSFYKNAKLVNTTNRNLYFLSELFEGVNENPAENFKLRYFHTDEKENKCTSCHNMTSNVPTNGEPFEDIKKTTCYECHNSMINKSNTHAPAANWLCVDCHNGKIGEYNMQDKGASKYLAPDPIAKTCGSCHDKIDVWQAQRYGHGPVNDGRCERCHDPHGSNNEFFLRKNIWDLCTTCHAEKANGKHVVSSFVFSRNAGAHPTKSDKDPSRPGRELTCSSCHNPHGSAGIYLLRMKGSMAFGVCRRCHKK